MTLRLWDVPTGAALQMLEGRSKRGHASRLLAKRQTVRVRVTQKASLALDGREGSNTAEARGPLGQDHFSRLLPR
jgi:hypothetical protein